MQYQGHDGGHHKHAVELPARLALTRPFVGTHQGFQGHLGPNQPHGPPTLEGEQHWCGVDWADPMLAEAPAPHGQAQDPCGSKQSPGPGKDQFGGLDQGQGVHMILVDVKIPNVEGQGQSRDEDKPLGPQDAVPAQLRMVCGGGRPHRGNQWGFHPNRFSKSAAPARHDGVRQGSKSQRTEHSGAPGLSQPQLSSVNPSAARPCQAPSTDHGPLGAVPKPPPTDGHVVGVPGVLDGALDGVPQPCGCGHPEGNFHLAALHGRPFRPPHPTEHGGDEGAKGNPEVGEGQKPPKHGTKFGRPWPPLTIWWTGC